MNLSMGSDMKVGDLVKLSAYGKLRNYNKRITLRDASQLGLVIAIHKGMYPYQVRWSKPQNGLTPNDNHSRRELAYARRKRQQ